jgi:thioredoxin
MFGIAPQTQAPADLIKDGTEASFLKDVIEESKTVPVIVDFWATWCGPCKTLGPALEAAVTAAKGKVKLVKIDVDKAQALSAQLRIQSIPTVYAFWVPFRGPRSRSSSIPSPQWVVRTVVWPRLSKRQSRCWSKALPPMPPKPLPPC